MGIQNVLFSMFFGMIPFSSSASVTPGYLDAVKSSAILDGKLLSVEHVTDPDFPDAEKTIANVPPRMAAKVLLQPAIGSNIQVEIWLPDTGAWNGRFVGLGNGGAAGSIHPTGFIGWLRQGYAVASTDMGTAPNDNSGVGNPEVWKDFGFRATHLMTATAKQLIRAYYGKEPEYSYFVGGSTGGQQALQEAQRYPEDYDGIIANIPAHCRTPLHAYFLWNYQIVHRCPFTPEQDRNIMAAGIEYMASREIPQLSGKAISDPRCNEADIEEVIRLAMKKDPSLTQTHADALRKIFNGPVNSAGERIFDGVPFGSSLLAATGNLYLFRWAFGAGKDLDTVNFDSDMDTYTRTLGPYLNAENPDLSAFEKRGGKLIMISGSADSVVPYHATLDYYERCSKQVGTLERLEKFFVFYIVPGMEHGINGIPDPFPLLVNWREHGVPPGVIRLHRQYAEETVDIPLYPYPGKTGYKTGIGFFPEQGARGVLPVAGRFLPAACE